MQGTAVIEVGNKVQRIDLDRGYVPSGMVNVLLVNSLKKAGRCLEEDKKNGKGKKYNYRNTTWGWQEFATNDEVAKELIINLCDSSPENDVVVVMFNHELVKKVVDLGISQKQVLFVADQGSVGKFMYLNELELYDVKSLAFDPCESIGKQIDKELNKMNAKKVHIVSNPPYNNNLDLKILEDVFSHLGTRLKSAHIVHPAGYLHQNLNKPVRELVSQRFVRLFGDKIAKVHLFNGNAKFGVKLSSTAWTITQFDFEKKDGGIDVKDDTKGGEEYHADDINGITVMGKGFADHNLAELFSRVEEYIFRHGSIDSHNVHSGELTDYSVKVARITGTTSAKEQKDAIESIKDDYFTVICKNSSRNLVGKEWEVEGKEFLSKNEHTTCWAFDDNETRMNFVDYLKTKFARFMLAYYKNSKNVGAGELAIIPWLDFTQKWDDKKLVETFEVTNDQWQFIDKFIPDYYADYKSGF